MDFYNPTIKLFANGEVDTANLKVVLLSGYTFDATETGLTAINAAEVSGNGWTAGGETIAGVTVTVTTTDDSTLAGTNISVTATGGDIGPATALAIVDATNSNPLFHYTFASSQTAGDGTNFDVNWNASGIVTWAN